MAGMQSIAGKIDAVMEKKNETKKDTQCDERVKETEHESSDKRDQV